MLTRRALLTIAGFALLSAASARAAKPSGPVVTDGAGRDRHGGEDVEFDMAMLEALPKTSFKTSNPWTEGGTEFEGVALKDLIAAVERRDGTLTARALNDYSASLPASEAAADGAIIAYKTNGEYMSVREKGPLWIVYPFDDNPDLKTETTYSRCVWQLAAVEFSDWRVRAAMQGAAASERFRFFGLFGLLSPAHCWSFWRPWLSTCWLTSPSWIGAQ